MENYKIDVSKPAENDLRGIISYISTNLCEPEIAVKTSHIIEKSIKELEHMPQKYPLVADDLLAAEGFRKFIIKNYIVFFTIDELEKTVNVERVLYARRDWVKIISSTSKPPSKQDTPATARTLPRLD
ncbi:MAG: type II toxin-antitoxin system RelE/ParE family toxin [Oscillospiraceae bacterium]|nr:type II toxin-antitoxin system RelE/ParE family toxin [Oscillospiraceae bacterium]